jgi:hypothetical protein
MIYKIQEKYFRIQKIMSRLVSHLIFFLILCAATIFAGWELLKNIRGDMVCDTFYKQIFPSPDRRWTAVVDQEECSIAFMNISDITFHIDLVTDRPVILRDVPIVSADTVEFDHDRLHIVWAAPGVLQVKIPWPARFTSFAKEVDGVRIDMRYDTSWIDEGKK